MPLYFLDTSALVKRYHREVGSAEMDRLFLHGNNSFVLSALTISEIASTFARKLREGLLSQRVVHQTLDFFSRDLLARFSVLDLERDQVDQSVSLILRHGLRAMDGLQLAACLSLAPHHPTLISADHRLLEAARAERLNVLNPEDVM